MDKLTVCASAASVAGIFLIYLFSLGFEPEGVEISEIDGGLKGETVRTEGTVRSVKLHEDGHVFLTVADGRSEIQVPIFSDVARDVPKISVGDVVRVTGYVDGYKGKHQIVPKSPRNVELLEKGREP